MAAIAYLYRVSPKATLIGNFSSSLDEPQLYGNVNKQQVHKIEKNVRNKCGKIVTGTGMTPPCGVPANTVTTRCRNDNNPRNRF